MSRRLDLATIALVLLVLTAPVLGVTDPSHSATEGVVYETNSGLEVTLADDREVEAVPFADDQTFASGNATLSSPGASAATVSDQTFGGSTMAVTGLDAASNPVTLGREDLSSDLTVAGGATGVILHDVALDDGATDVEVTADSSTTLQIDNVGDVDAVSAVDSTGEVVAATTQVSGGTATLSIDAGEYDLKLQTGSSTLEIRDLYNQTLITETASGDPLNVTVQAFGEDGTTFSETTTDGTIDMTGFPADERFAITIDAGQEYYERTIIIPSLVEQSTAYLLPVENDTEVVQPRFFLEDPSNQFDAETAELVFKRPIEINGSTEFVAVTGDRIGLNGFDTTLEEGQRYRVVVTDPESGAQRQLGEYTATASERITLTVQDVEFDSVSDIEGIDWTARYNTVESGANEIKFIYRDEQDTTELRYKIYERGNESNVLANATANGNVTVTETVPPSESDLVWTVEWTATRANGDTFSASRPVSTSRLPVGPALAPEWQTVVSMLGLIVVAGLFGAASPGVGGIAVASTGGFFFLLGWLPDSTGPLMVLLALFIAVLSYAGRKARGATV
jgi:hypothetical protein